METDLVSKQKRRALSKRALRHRRRPLGDLNPADIKIFLILKQKKSAINLITQEKEGGTQNPNLEVGSSEEEGGKVAEAEVGGAAVAAEGVEVAAADEDDLGDAKSGGAPGEGSDVVPLRDVVDDDRAFDRRCMRRRQRRRHC